jgi:glycerol uptake facilitator protein
MSPFLAEIVGTALLILFGNGAVANALLTDTKGHAAGPLFITAGWGIAVFIGVFVSSAYSGGHLNPAVTLGLAAVGKFPLAKVPLYIAAQFLGAALGAVSSWLCYKRHFDVTENSTAIRACFCTSPQIRGFRWSFVTETVATIVLLLAVFYAVSPQSGLGAVEALPIGLVVFGIGMSLGGTTGWAINPARDLAPRLVHQLLPIRNKTDSDWGYAWVPVLAPCTGAMIAAVMYRIFLIV